MSQKKNRYQKVECALGELKKGHMIIVVDDEDRENEGDLVMAAESATAEAINFMAKFGRGLICVPLEQSRLEDFGLHDMVQKNSSMYHTAFTISVDAKEGITTGISAADRALTIKILADSSKGSTDVVVPGHIFPLRAVKGGVLKRAGHTEAAVDLSRLAGFGAAGVICEILKDDGTMARYDDLKEFARVHGLVIVSIADLISYRLKTENLVKEKVVARIPTPYGNFQLHLYHNLIDDFEHLALVYGEPANETIGDKQKGTLVRVHSECMTGDIFQSTRCDCGEQLHTAMKMIAANGHGVVLYMRQEGRGIGLANKLKAYNLQDEGFDTVEANHKLGLGTDLRDYGVGAQILRKIGLKKINLITNNPRKVAGIKGYGLEIISRVPLEIPSNPENKKYLETKKNKMGHLIMEGISNVELNNKT